MDARVEKVPGGSFEDSRIDLGIVLNKAVVHGGMRRRIENSRVVLLECWLEFTNRRVRRRSTVWTERLTQLRHDADHVRPAVGRKRPLDDLQFRPNSRKPRLLRSRNNQSSTRQRLRDAHLGRTHTENDMRRPRKRAKRADRPSVTDRRFSVSLTPPRRKTVHAAPAHQSMNSWFSSPSFRTSNSLACPTSPPSS